MTPPHRIPILPGWWFWGRCEDTSEGIAGGPFGLCTHRLYYLVFLAQKADRDPCDCHRWWLPRGHDPGKRGYTPDVIVVQHGKPVRRNFRHEEMAVCSEMGLLPDFGKSIQLPTGQTVTVEFLPDKPGEYEFACQMGMRRGKLIVE
ncbi:MAG: cupredoxin domain-containing protein [Gammaproteobacteria bacterium]